MKNQLLTVPMASLKQKVDVVLVERKTRGKFPGKKAPKGTRGLVWSRWVSNGVYSTEKISILSEESKIFFTTVKCTRKVGSIIDFPTLLDAYKRYAESNFIPVFGFFYRDTRIDRAGREHRRVFCSTTRKDEYLNIKFLSRDRITSVPASCIHFEDLEEMFSSKERVGFFCMRIESWFLKRVKLV